MSTYKVIGKNGKPLHVDVLLHPGEILTEELSVRHISQRMFAKSTKISPSSLNVLLKGKRHVSATLALKLEKQLGIDAAFWMRLQVDYDLKVARKKMKVA